MVDRVVHFPSLSHYTNLDKMELHTAGSVDVKISTHQVTVNALKYAHAHFVFVSVFLAIKTFGEASNLSSSLLAYLKCLKLLASTLAWFVSGPRQCPLAGNGRLPVTTSSVAHSKAEGAIMGANERRVKSISRGGQSVHFSSQAFLK